MLWLNFILGSNFSFLCFKLKFKPRTKLNRDIYKHIYLTGFAKMWLKKFQVHFKHLTSKLNGKQ